MPGDIDDVMCSLQCAYTIACQNYIELAERELEISRAIVSTLEQLNVYLEKTVAPHKEDR